MTATAFRLRVYARVWPVIASLCIAVVAGRVVSAQDLTLGAIEGVVVDQTGLPLPGATIVLTSPALQVRQLETQSDADGRYRFSDLRIGVYSLQVTLQGFQTVVRENVQLSAGFVARIDLPMSVGGVNETLTVSAASPVIDLTSTRGGRTLDTRVLLESVPVVGHVVDLVKMTPGMDGVIGTRAGNPTQQGQNATGAGSAFGQAGATLLLDGFEQASATPNTSILDSAEMDVKTYGNSAEIQSPGYVANFVYPSGGNQFRGGMSTGFMHSSLQGTNLDADDAANPRLRSLFASPEAVRYHSDVHGNLGGRIVPDTLWFFGSLRYRTSERTVGGFVQNAGPDGRYLTGDEPSAHPTAVQTSHVQKISYQITPKYQLVGFSWRDHSEDKPQVSGVGMFGGGSYATVPYEASSAFSNVGYVWNGQFRGTPASNLMIEARAGKSGNHVTYDVAPESAAKPSMFERTTQLYTGPSISHGGGVGIPGGGQAERDSHPYFYLLAANLAYSPRGELAGTHAFKAGFEAKLKTSETRAPNHLGGNYILVFDGGQPVEMMTLSLPLHSRDRVDTHAAYLTDQWRVGRSLTFNLGVRFQNMRSYIPAQSREASTFAAAASYPASDIGAWNDWQPRLAVAWDPTGSARTVVKATYGRFADPGGQGSTLFSEPYNPAVTTLTTYRWRDPNGNRNYDPGEVNLATTSANPDFITISGAQNIKPLRADFKNPRTDEITVSVERELLANTSGRVLYVYKGRANDFATINVARPYSAFNIPLQRRDPGPDGNVNTPDDGPMVTIYDYDPAFRGSQFVLNERVNRPSDRNDVAQTFEVALARRMSNGWNVGVSYDALKQHRWLTPIATSPNDDHFPIDETWKHTFRANGSYRLPYGVDAGGTLVMLSGVPGQRTYVFRAQDPLGGRPLQQQTTVNLRLEPFGASHGPVQPYLDLRVSKRFTIQSFDVMLSADVLNALNTNVAQATTFASGPTYGQITQISPPRALRLGGQFFF